MYTDGPMGWGSDIFIVAGLYLSFFPSVSFLVFFIIHRIIKKANPETKFQKSLLKLVLILKDISLILALIPAGVGIVIYFLEKLTR